MLASACLPRRASEPVPAAVEQPVWGGFSSIRHAEIRPEICPSPVHNADAPVPTHTFVLDPGKFPFFSPSLGDERVFSPAASSATRRWLWDVPGFENVPGVRLQMSLGQQGHSVLSASLAMSPAVPTRSQCLGGLGTLGGASVAPLLSPGIQEGQCCCDVPSDVTVPYAHPKDHGVNLFPFPTVPSPR